MKKILFITIVLWSSPAYSFNAFHQHGDAVLYHETVVEQVELYMRSHKFKREPMMYFIQSCAWLKLYSAATRLTDV